MTTAYMVAYLKSTLDELGAVAEFYVDPADYYEALNEAQMQVLNDMLGGDDKDFDGCRTLIVSESLADGATLTDHCYLPLSVTDPTGTRRGTIKFSQQFRAYHGVTAPLFLQAEVRADVLHTTPAAAS